MKSKLYLTLTLVGAMLMATAEGLPPSRRTVAQLHGAPGELFEMSMNARCYSKFARTTVYDEADNAFATQLDSRKIPGWGIGWQGEYWGKTMLSYAAAIRYTKDPELTRWAIQKAHEFVKKYQRPNGYLSSYHDESQVRSQHFPDGGFFNIWSQKYTMWALLELHEATGDEECLKAAERMGDHLCANLKKLGFRLCDTGSGPWGGVNSMSILKPLVILNRHVPKAAYKELIEDTVRWSDVAEGEKQPIMNLIQLALSGKSIKEWFDNPTLAKAYEMMSYFEGLLEYYKETKNERVLAAVKAFWQRLMDEELNAMRSAGYFDHFMQARIHVNAMTEHCDVVHWMKLCRELYFITDETKYLDAFEECYYNAFQAGVSADGAWGAHIIRSHGSRHLSAPSQVGMVYHQCCPDNMLRGFGDFAETVAYETKSGALELNFYGDADLTLGGVQVRIRGNYPIGDNFRIVTRADKPTTFHLRAPAWTKWAKVNGAEAAIANGRFALAIPQGITAFTVAFDMSPRILDSAAPEVDDIYREPVRGKSGKGYTEFFMSWMCADMEGVARTHAAATVMRGPLVLAKGRAAGTTRNDTLAFKSINKRGFTARLEPIERTAANRGVWGAWKLVLTKEGEVHTLPVADFWSVSKFNDPENYFSLWF